MVGESLQLSPAVSGRNWELGRLLINLPDRLSHIGLYAIVYKAILTMAL
jgi:hypothetical protein